MTLKFFDAHFHLFEPRFHIQENQGWKPSFFTLEDYKKRLEKMHLCAVGGAVVSASFQGYDTSYLEYALKVLGPNFAGVAQLKENISEDEIFRLKNIGIRAVRYNFKRGAMQDEKKIKEFAKKVYEIAGWHVELYIDSSDLKKIQKTLLELPKVCIDHLGLSKKGIPSLLYLVEKGISVKGTGFGRLDFEPLSLIKQIHLINPNALMFGTDLPSTRSKKPFCIEDLNLIKNHFSSHDQELIFYKNAAHFYR